MTVPSVGKHDSANIPEECGDVGHRTGPRLSCGASLLRRFTAHEIVKIGAGACQARLAEVMNPDEQAWRRHTTACRWMQGAAIRLNANCRRAQGARAVASRRDGRLQKSKQEQDGRRNDQQSEEHTSE